jgi:hypothetical protein
VPDLMRAPDGHLQACFLDDDTKARELDKLRAAMLAEAS